ncbi:MAG TPA: acetylornithine transaminase [Methanomassiliicoccales archaeon]|nr:acetylornithine transaminase [Methanomassiliicoccales archaeon]
MDLKGVKTLYESYLFSNYGREDLVIDHGEKEFLFDESGNKYIDYVAGIAVNCLGHGHPALVNAISEQVRRMIHVSNLYYTQQQADLGEALASIVPSPLEISMLCNSGAEANEAALKLATKHTKRGRFVACVNSFHGRTAGALSATGQLKYQEGFEPLISKCFDHTGFNDVEGLKEKITAQTAGVLLEVVQGEGGVLPAEQDFMRTARELCDEKGALLIIDEVQTGMARTGRWFGFEHYGVVPDIITLAKGLGGGMPIGAIVARRDVGKTFTPGSHGTTFGGNPLACAAATAVIKTIKKEVLVQRSADAGNAWMSRLSAIAKAHPLIKDVRGAGLMIGIEMGDKVKDFQKYAFSEGLLVNVAAGKVVRLVPPLIMSDSSMLRFDRVLQDYLDRQ